MFLTTPRIPPLPESEWDDEMRALLKPLGLDGSALNIFTTVARHPRLMKKWLVFASHVLSGSTLPPRDRELAILRIGWLCRADYEWGHHVPIGQKAGLNSDDIKRVAQGPDAPGLDPFDSTLLRAVDQLHEKSFMEDAVWHALAERYSTEQLLDFVFTVGQYNLVSMFLNTVGVQLEDGFKGFSA